MIKKHHAGVAAAALPGASAEIQATGAGGTALLNARFKTGSLHPRVRDDSEASHAHINLILARITAVVPGLARLSAAELKKKDVSALNLPEEPSGDRTSLTGCSYSEKANAAFRRSLLKFVEKEVTSAEYNAFVEDTELLRVAFNLLKSQSLKRWRDDVGRADRYRRSAVECVVYSRGRRHFPFYAFICLVR